MAHNPGFLKLVNDAKSRVARSISRATRSMRRSGENPRAGGYSRRQRMERRPRRRRGAPEQGRHRARHRNQGPGQATPSWCCTAAAASAPRWWPTTCSKMGYTNAISLDGGWRALKESGLPLE